MEVVLYGFRIELVKDGLFCSWVTLVYECVVVELEDEGLLPTVLSVAFWDDMQISQELFEPGKLIIVGL